MSGSIKFGERLFNATIYRMGSYQKRCRSSEGQPEEDVKKMKGEIKYGMG